MATLESLQAKIKKLEQQAESLIAKQSSSIVEKIRDLMERHGLTAADIAAPASRKQRARNGATRSAAAAATGSDAKYRDPKTGATWSGRGRAPGWIVSAKNRAKYLVIAGTSAATPAPKKAKAAGNYVRGPQPAMYRDPKSGATWSGRGRAPAWLNSAKDRTKFMIDGPNAVVVTTPKTVKLKTDATKTVVRKAAAKNVATEKAAVKKVAAKKVAVTKPVSEAASTRQNRTVKNASEKKSPVASRKASEQRAPAGSEKKAPAQKLAKAGIKRPAVKKVSARKTPEPAQAVSTDVATANTDATAASGAAVGATA